jgi:hypothetical protein
LVGALASPSLAFDASPGTLCATLVSLGPRSNTPRRSVHTDPEGQVVNATFVDDATNRCWFRRYGSVAASPRHTKCAFSNERGRQAFIPLIDPDQ